MDFNRFAQLADRMMEQVPPPLLKGLTGGVVVRHEACRRRGDPPGVYRLGEYVNDEFLGAFIVLYYGSFRRLLASEPPHVWEQELWDTLRHELRHHIEARAGVRDLELEDEAFLQQLWDEWEQSRPTSTRRRG